jgi:hypothetical protein
LASILRVVMLSTCIGVVWFSLLGVFDTEELEVFLYFLTV